MIYFFLGIVLLVVLAIIIFWKRLFPAEKRKPLPQPNFTITPTPGIVNKAVKFTASSSTNSGGEIVKYTWDFGDGKSGIGEVVEHFYELEDTYRIVLTVTNAQGETNSTAKELKVAKNLPNQIPIPVITMQPADNITVAQTVKFLAVDSIDPDGIIVQYTWDFGDGETGTDVATEHVYQAVGNFLVTLTVKDNNGGKNSITRNIEVMSSNEPNPPDLEIGAPPIDQTVVTDLATAIEFLYTGDDPVQTGVLDGAIEAKRVAVLRGKVSDNEGEPLPDVIIKVRQYSEFGQTKSRANGLFDLAINGGQSVTVCYEKEGYLPLCRCIRVPWRDYIWLPEVVLTEFKQVPSVFVDLTNNSELQTVKGKPVKDKDGERQAFLIIPPDTKAKLLFADGMEQPLANMNLRIIEYTEGERGPKAMPADLPPNTGYTFCAKYHVKEAVAAGAVKVTFDKTIYHYMENFLNFPVGEIVPIGYFEREIDAWIPEENGRVVKIVAINNELAELDVDGSENPADDFQLAELNITDIERKELALQYSVGQSLWRMPVAHFSEPDGNPALMPPEGSEPANQKNPTADKNTPDSCLEEGSIIDIQNQILSESIPLSGTEHSLYYHSDRVPGRRLAYSLDIALTGDTLPNKLKMVELRVLVAGRQFKYSFEPQVNLTYTFFWDGKDAFGRMVQGLQPVTLRIGYTYPATYQRSRRRVDAIAMPTPQLEFGAPSGVSMTTNPSRLDATLWQTLKTTIGALDLRGLGLGGWSLGQHHSYDPDTETFYQGNGRQRKTKGESVVIHSKRWEIKPNKAINSRELLALDNQGQIYITASSAVTLKENFDEPQTRIAGLDPFKMPSSGYGSWSSFKNAKDAVWRGIHGIEIASDGSFYVAERGGDIWRVSLQNSDVQNEAVRIAKIAVQGGIRIAIDQNDRLYYADVAERKIYRLEADGKRTHLAGNGEDGVAGDGGPAVLAQFRTVHCIAVGPDGSIYIAENNSYRIRQVRPDGTIHSFVGDGTAGFSGDGGPAKQAQIGGQCDIDVDADGNLYIADTNNHRIRRVGSDGIINTVAGNGEFRRNISPKLISSGEQGQPAMRLPATGPRQVRVSPDGSLYFIESHKVNNAGDYRHYLRHIPANFLGYVADGIFVTSKDGRELYHFNNHNRHLATVDALTGEFIYGFTYDNQNRLVEIKNKDGLMTVIEYDGTNPHAVVGPFGHKTILRVNNAGYLDQITDPAGRNRSFTYYDEAGLLATMTDPRGGEYRFEYDDWGRLKKDTNPADGYKLLSRKEYGDAFEVRVITPSLHESKYRVEHLPDGNQIRENSCCGGQNIKVELGNDEVKRITYADGIIVQQTMGPDIRWGMQSPILQTQTITTPDGLEAVQALEQEVELADPKNKMSLLKLTEKVTLNGRLYQTTFDKTAKTITSTTPMNRQQSTVLDEQGRVLEAQILGQATVKYAYDTNGNLTSITHGSRELKFEYAARGNLEKIVDPLQRESMIAYDAADRPQKLTTANGREIAFGYDENNNITSVTPPGKPTHQFSYTAVNQIESYTPPSVGLNNHTTRYSYTPEGQLQSVERPDNKTILFEYDDAGRLETTQIEKGIIKQSYDPTTGQLQSITAPDGSKLTYQYDGRLLTKTELSGEVSGTVAQSYNDDFRVVAQTVNDNFPVKFAYDKDGLLTRAGEMILTPDAENGRLTGTELNKLNDSLTYNNQGELETYKAISDTDELFATAYEYDELGRIVQITETIEGTTRVYTYTYDDADRLYIVERDGVQIAKYEYDENGNRLSFTDEQGVVVEGSYDDQDRLLQYGDTTYECTANGELRQKNENGQITEYAYDELGNLLQVNLANGDVIEYLIDGQNRRIGKKVNGTLVQGFLYQDDLNPVAELDGNGNVVSRFVYAEKGHVPAYMIRDGETYRIISDHLGSVRLVVYVATGEVVQRLDYDAFGQILENSNPGYQPFGFASGLYEEETNLIRFGIRDYDASLGRWTVKDPIRFLGGSNFYSYVSNDPANYIDPTGLANLRGATREGAKSMAKGGAGIVVGAIGTGIVGFFGGKVGAVLVVSLLIDAPWVAAALVVSGGFIAVSVGLFVGGVAAYLAGEIFDEIWPDPDKPQLCPAES